MAISKAIQHELEQKRAKLADRLWNDHTWYRKAKNANGFLWYATQIVIICAGIFGSFLVAVQEEYDLPKYFVAGIPALGSIAAALQGSFRFRQLYMLREQGRIDVFELWQRAKRIPLGSEAEFNKARAKFEQARVEVSRRQARAYFTFISGHGDGDKPAADKPPGDPPTTPPAGSRSRTRPPTS